MNIKECILRLNYEEKKSGFRVAESHYPHNISNNVFFYIPTTGYKLNSPYFQ